MEAVKAKKDVDDLQTILNAIPANATGQEEFNPEGIVRSPWNVQIKTRLIECGDKSLRPAAGREAGGVGEGVGSTPPTHSQNFFKLKKLSYQKINQKKFMCNNQLGF